MISPIAVDSIINIFIFLIIIIIVIIIFIIIMVIMIPAVNDNPGPIDRGGRTVSEPRALVRGVAVLGDSLLVGHVPGRADHLADPDADHDDKTSSYLISAISFTHAGFQKPKMPHKV